MESSEQPMDVNVENAASQILSNELVDGQILLSFFTSSEQPLKTTLVK